MYKNIKSRYDYFYQKYKIKCNNISFYKLKTLCHSTSNKNSLFILYFKENVLMILEFFNWNTFTIYSFTIYIEKN